MKFRKAALAIILFLHLALIPAKSDNFTSVNVTGDAAIGGILDISGNLIKFGLANISGITNESTPHDALWFAYMDGTDPVGIGSVFKLSATKQSVSWLWEQHSPDINSSAYLPKMKLGETNILQLFNGSGDAAIALNPNASGTAPGLTFGPGLGLRFNDASGNAVVQIDSTGTPRFTKGITFTGGGTLDSGNVTYLQQLLYNLGYNADRVPTSDLSLAFPSEGMAAVVLSKATIDAAGAIYICGKFASTATLAPYQTVTSAGGNDGFVAKLNVAGGMLWKATIGSEADEYAKVIAVDTVGNVYVAGTFSGSLKIGNTAMLNSNGMQDIFVAKFSATGDPLWSAQAGGASSDDIQSIAVDSSGNVGIMGKFAVSANFGATTLTTAATYWGAGYLARLNSSGQFVWAKKCEGSSNLSMTGFGMNSVGDKMVVTGTFSGTGTLAGNSLTSYSGVQAGFLLGLDGTTGATRFAKLLSSVYGESSPAGLNVLANGEADVYGTFTSTTTFAPLYSISSSGSADGFILHLDANGVYTRVLRMGGTSYDQIMSSTRDAAGNLYVYGNFAGSTNFLPGGPAASYRCLVKYSSSDAVMWAQILPNTLGASQLLAGANKVLLTGFINSNTRIGEEVLVGPGGYAYIWDGNQISASAGMTNERFSWGTSVAEQAGSIALGANALSRGQYAFAGGASTAIGDYSTAFGQGATAFGLSSIALGSSVYAGGGNSIALGSASVAMGNGSFAEGYYSMALGNTSFAAGSVVKASGDYSTAFGMYTRAGAFASFAIGKYNIGSFGDSGTGPTWDDGDKNWIASDPVFEVGNGTDDTHRSNAVTVFKNGSAIFSGPVRVAPSGDVPMFVP